jgi:adenylate cyclase
VASTRRLAAIMFTDTVGYTSAAQSDEASALQMLREQEELVRPAVSAHHGREIKSTGDGLLVEFDSALRATQCGIEIQRRIHERNARTGFRPILIRVGIHLGDVEQRGTDILGDAVNIAARIEPTAVPGGVCVSGAVYEQVRNKIPEKLEKLPPTTLKGLEAPTDIYRVLLPWMNPPAPADRTQRTGLAVLPFANISPDPNDAYFADGLTEELITVLSQLRSLRVIARTSVTPYRGSSKGVSEIGRELGVSSLLEGSVRKAGNRLRIAVQLIDVATQGHLWARSYDRELVDVFAIQAEIAREVAEALKISLGSTEEARLSSRPTVRPDSYLAYLKGRVFLRDRTESALTSAREQFELAVRLDARSASAYSGLSDVTMLQSIYVGSRNAADIEASRSYALRALELDPALAEAHASLAHAFSEELRFAEAEKEFLLALSLNPSYSPAHHWYSLLLRCQARPEDALREILLAEEGDPLSVAILASAAMLLVQLRRMGDAAAKLEKLGAVENFGEFYHLTLYEFYMAQSDSVRALHELDLLNERFQGDPALLPGYALYYAQSGQKERALEYLRKVEALQTGIPFKNDIIGGVYAELGDLDEAFRWMEKGVEDRTIVIQSWRLNPRFERLRADPRFQRVLERLNLA